MMLLIGWVKYLKPGNLNSVKGRILLRLDYANTDETLLITSSIEKLDDIAIIDRLGNEVLLKYFNRN